jgi:hypothetical protein
MPINAYYTSADDYHLSSYGPATVCLQEVLGGRSELAASDIPKLVVAEACFKEALRLHPPAGNVGRDAAHDTVIKVKGFQDSNATTAYICMCCTVCVAQHR